MNSIQGPVPGHAALVDLVDFKWLMAGLGWRVDLSRLQDDARYAHDFLQLGAASGPGVLRSRSVHLLTLLPKADRPQVRTVHGD